MAATSPTPLQMNYSDDQAFVGQITLSDSTHPDLTAGGVALTFYIGSSASPLVTKTLGSGVVGDSSGNFTVTISHSDASVLKSGTYIYSLVYTPAGGSPSETVAFGAFYVLAQARP